VPSVNAWHPLQRRCATKLATAGAANTPTADAKPEQHNQASRPFLW
jgi:hypothetical protein